jgi:hypothetical protein
MYPQQDLHFTNVNICTQITENFDIGEMKVLLGTHLEFSVICVHILTLVK